MSRRRDIESIAFDACVIAAVLMLLYALFVPHLRSPAIDQTSTAVRVELTPKPPARAPRPSNPAPALSAQENAASAAMSPNATVSTSSAPTPSNPAPAEPTAATAAPIEPVTVESPVPVMDYAVDAGMFRERSNAEGLAKRAWDRYRAQAVITPIVAHGRTLYRVRLLVETHEKATSVADALLQDEKLEARVRPIE